LLAKGRHWQLSVENRFPCTVTKITAGDIFVELELKTSFVNIRSLVDREAFNRLNVVCGEELNAFVKANEISLMLDTSA